MQVLNSYLQLHNAVIMLTALPNHKIHTHTQNTQIRKPTRLFTTCRPTRSLYRSLSLSLTFHRLRLCPKSLHIYQPYLHLTIFPCLHLFAIVAWNVYASTKTAVSVAHNALWCFTDAGKHVIHYKNCKNCQNILRWKSTNPVHLASPCKHMQTVLFYNS